jgi:hypothetical protein
MAASQVAPSPLPAASDAFQTMAEIRNYTMNFGSSRAARLTRTSFGLACTEIHLRRAGAAAASFDSR